MPKRRRRSAVPVPVWDRDRGAIGRTIAGRNPRFYATAGVVGLLVVAVALVAFAFLNNYLEDRNRPGSTAVKVEDTNYTVRYFTERLNRFIQQSGGSGSLFGQQPQAALGLVADELIDEALLLRFAADQGQSATEDEVKAEIAKMLTLTGPDDPTFETRFREELTRTNVTEQQYRDMARAAVLKTKVEAKVHRRSTRDRRVHPLPPDHSRDDRPDRRRCPRQTDRGRRRLRATCCREVYRSPA